MAESASVSRRAFLGWMAAFAAAPTLAAPAGADRTCLPLAPFPLLERDTLYGAGTSGLERPDLLVEALARGVRLVDTSPDYRGGETETWVGRALSRAREPVFVMTQLPVEAWRAENREVACRRALKRSLDRLRRHRVEALLVRNAEPWQLADPGFRAFARDALRRGWVGRIGASGHGPDVEPVLAMAAEDDLIGLVLLGAHLAGLGTIPDLLPKARARGVILVAMKSREASLWARDAGWEREEERRRHAPWNGGWDPGFTHRALSLAAARTRAHNVVMSLRTPDDLRSILAEG